MPLGKLTEIKLQMYWDSLPIGKENAISYAELQERWNCCNRTAREILAQLSMFEDKSNFILIRSSRHKGFYKTDNIKEIEAFRKECLNRGRACFAPIHRINKVLDIHYIGGFDLLTALDQMEAQEAH